MSKKKYVTIPTHLIGKVSSTALIIYALLADRQELSVKQGYRFRDHSGYYIIYTETDLSEVIGISVRTVRRMLTELVGAGLIRTRKQGKGLPQKIYVNTDTDDEALSQVDDQTASDRTEMSAQERTEMAGQERTDVSGLNIYQEDSYPDAIYPHPTTQTHTTAKGKCQPHRRKDEDEDDITHCIYKSDPSMTADDVEEIKNRIARNRGFIHNVKAYIKAVVENYRLEKSIPAPQARESQLAAYDLKAYETESVFDYLSEDDLAEIKAEVECTQK